MARNLFVNVFINFNDFLKIFKDIQKRHIKETCSLTIFFLLSTSNSTDITFVHKCIDQH